MAYDTFSIWHFVWYFLAERSSISDKASERDEEEGSRPLDSPAASFLFALWEAGIRRTNPHAVTFKRALKIAI
jgi:hypothetical protein